MEDWLKTRPKVIQDLATKYPPGTKLSTEQGYVFVVSYYEDGSLSVSRIDPRKYYDAAVETRYKICSHCVEQINQEESYSKRDD